MKPHKSAVLVSIILIIIFLPSCSNEPSLIEQAMIQEEQQKALDAAKANQTKQEQKEIIPADFLEACEFNHAIELYEYRENGVACMDEEDRLTIYIKNVGFDSITSLKLKLGDKEIVTEENDLDPDKMRIYRIDAASIDKSTPISIIPRGEFYDRNIYDCEKSKVILSTKNIEDCLV